ncbi:unnamed protein product [Closterium sp. Yama58-4]|nr:unnamed protein product [Closterium sp. Yama58-4]
MSYEPMITGMGWKDSIPWPIISLSAFLARFKSWDHMDIGYHGVGKGHSTQQLQQQRGVFLLIRQPQEGRYAFMICNGSYSENPVTPDKSILVPTAPLLGIIDAIVASMGGEGLFFYVHVRRGDKLDPRKWPHLDRDTRPEAYGIWSSRVCVFVQGEWGEVVNGCLGF